METSLAFTRLRPPEEAEDSKGHIPYDLRDTFATEVAINYGTSGREAAQRLMGHESGESIEAYLVDQLPSDLRLYAPFGERSRGLEMLTHRVVSRRQLKPTERTC